MFQAGLLLIIRRIDSVQTAIGIVKRCVDWPLVGSGWTETIVVYTELIFLMTSSKPAQNM
jgi:hypothetical protein